MHRFSRFVGSVSARLIVSVCGSLLMVAVIFPELMVQLNYSPVRFMDSEFLYAAVFSLAQNFFSLRLQLWNVFDQMPMAFVYLTGGMTYANVITGLSYTLSSSFSSDQGQLFFANYAIVYNVISTVIRGIGVYLLVSLFTRNTSTMLLTSIFAATVASVPNYLGLNCGSLYALFPFVSFFLLRWIDTRRSLDLILLLLSLMVGVAFDPLVGLGYFYQGVHFLILSALLWLGVAWFRNTLPVTSQAQTSSGIARKWHWVAALVLIAVVMGPWTALLLTNYGDYELAHETSRFANILSVSAYFERQHFGASPRLLPALMVVYSKNQWAFQWLFLGWTFVFFVFCGIVLSRDRRKHIFLLTATAFWLLQFPRDPGSVWSVAHWANALTNPFSSVVRSAHMTGAFLLPYALLPLFVLGVDSFFRHCRREISFPTAARFSVLLALVAIVAVTGIRYSIRSTGLSSSIEVAYIAVIPVLFLSVMLASRISRIQSRKIVAGAIAVLALSIAMDLVALRQYVYDVARQMQVVAHKFEGIPERFLPIRVDRQNPRMLPVREHYVFESPGQPSAYIGTDPINMQGLFYQYANLGKFLEKPSNYKPRHKAYRNLHFDPVFRTYLARDTRLSFLADVAVRDEPGVFEQLVDQGLERRAIVVSGADDMADSYTADIGSRVRTSQTETSQSAWHEIRFRVRDAIEAHDDDGGARRLLFRLSDSFPKWLASTPLTDDRENLSVRLDDMELIPVQGWLDRPGRFDLQNIRQGALAILVTEESATDADKEVVLRYRFTSPVNAGNVRIFTPDEIGFTLQLEKPRWLVMHMPYDERWRFSVNGKNWPHYRANRSFTAVQLPAGSNVILVSYWPGSPLRWLIPASFVVCLAVLVFLFGIAFRLSNSAARARRG